MSDEHVIPKSLGGTDELMVRVNRPDNNELGTRVDGVVAKEFFAFYRRRFELEGHSGAVPEFEVPIEIEALEGQKGWWAPFSNRPVVLRPVVTRRKTEDGRTEISIVGSPEEARRIFEDMKKAHEAKGRTVQAHAELEQQIDKPRISGRLSIDALAVTRFYAKVALGVGHWLWGEPWSRSEDAAPLRAVLWSQSLQEADSTGLESGALNASDIGLVLAPSEHCFIATSDPSHGYALAAFTFGGVGRTFRVGRSGGVLDSLWTDQNIVLIDVLAKRVRRLALLDLVREGKARVPSR